MKKFLITLAVLAATFNAAAQTQPAAMTAYAKCQLAMPEFDSFDYHVYKDDVKMTACMQLSTQIAKAQFAGDYAKFQTWYRDNAMAITMEVKADYK